MVAFRNITVAALAFAAPFVASQVTPARIAKSFKELTETSLEILKPVLALDFQELPPDAGSSIDRTVISGFDKIRFQFDGLGYILQGIDDEEITEEERDEVVNTHFEFVRVHVVLSDTLKKKASLLAPVLGKNFEATLDMFIDGVYYIEERIEIAFGNSPQFGGPVLSLLENYSECIKVYRYFSSMNNRRSIFSRRRAVTDGLKDAVSGITDAGNRIGDVTDMLVDKLTDFTDDVTNTAEDVSGSALR